MLRPARSVGGEGILAQVKRQTAKLIGQHRRAVALFYGPDGALTREAVDWLGEVADKAGINHSTFDRDPHVSSFREGRRSLALDILASASLDATQLDLIRRQMKENSHVS